MNDNFLKTHYCFVQIVNVGTRGNAVLDKIWTNMDKVYMSPAEATSEASAGGGQRAWEQTRAINGEDSATWRKDHDFH